MKRRSDSILGRPAQTSRLGDTRTTETTCNRLCGHTTFNWSAICWFCVDGDRLAELDAAGFPPPIAEAIYATELDLSDQLPAGTSLWFDSRPLLEADTDVT